MVSILISPSKFKKEANHVDVSYKSIEKETDNVD